MDVTEYWDFGNPEKTETVFLELAEKATDENRTAIFMTQVARTFSLRSAFDKTRDVLATIDRSLSPEVDVRWNLEMGRAENSAGNKDKARPYFEEATRVALQNNLEYLAVDAVHMEAIGSNSPESALKLNERALELAENSSDEKARGWQGSLLNNLGWAYHDLKRFEDAKTTFEKCVLYFEEKQDDGRTRIARWSVARVLRSLEQYEEALTIQRRLLDEEGDSTGYTHQEIAWNLHALGQSKEAKPFFETAVTKLESDSWYAKNNADELAKMRELI